MTYTVRDESTAIAFPITESVPDKYVYETSVPAELYLRANIEPTVDIGKVLPEDVGVKVIVFIVTADAETYRPMMYTSWDDEPTAIPLPTSLPDDPLKYVYETSVPDELYLRTNISDPADIGKVFPDDVGVKVIVFIVTADAELEEPVMYTFWDESTAILLPITEMVPPKYVYETSVPDELYLRTNIPVPVTPGKVFPDDVGVKVIVFIVTADAETYSPVMYIFPDESAVIEFPEKLLLFPRFVYKLTLPYTLPEKS